MHPNLGACWLNQEVMQTAVRSLFTLFSPALFTLIDKEDYLGSCGVVQQHAPDDGMFADLIVACATAYLDSIMQKRHKWGLPKALQKAPRAVRLIQEESNGRCALCGWNFSDGTAELDHILPWRFVRDPAGGANWRLLCGPCNRAKTDHFSAAMTQAWLGWPAREGALLLLHGWPVGQAQYAVLSRDRVCSVCNVGPGQRRLAVRLRGEQLTNGLNLANLEVVCDEHCGTPLLEALVATRKAFRSPWIDRNLDEEQP